VRRWTISLSADVQRAKAAGSAAAWLLKFWAQVPKIQAMRDERDSIISSVAAPNHVGSPCLPARSAPGALESIPIKWNHLIDKDSLKIKELEHVLIQKVEQLFRDMR